VQHCPTLNDFLTVIGSPPVPGVGAGSGDAMIYSRVRNAITAATNEYEERRYERMKDARA
jgi:hypothetical protein